MAALLVMTTIREMELSNAEIRVNNLIAVSESNARLKQCAAFYIQAAWASYLERLQRSQSSSQSSALLGNELLHSDGRFCRTMRRFRGVRKELMKPNDLLHMLFQARAAADDELMSCCELLKMRVAAASVSSDCHGLPQGSPL
jgi:hypothetical protein